MCRESEQLGLTVLRTWAFADGPQWNSIQPNLGQLDERVLSQVSQRLRTMAVSLQACPLSACNPPAPWLLGKVDPRIIQGASLAQQPRARKATSCQRVAR